MSRLSVTKKWAALALLLFGCISAWADTITGKVIAVTDGDTIRVLDAQHIQHKVRLAGIDAPESKQAYGARSKKNLSDLVFGKTVTVEFTKHDRYGRIVGKVLHEKLDIDLQQIEAGLAWHYKQYAKEQSMEDRLRYADAESHARAARLGLWLDVNPVPPWEWRRGSKSRLHQDYDGIYEAERAREAIYWVAETRAPAANVVLAGLR